MGCSFNQATVDWNKVTGSEVVLSVIADFVLCKNFICAVITTMFKFYYLVKFNSSRAYFFGALVLTDCRSWEADPDSLSSDFDRTVDPDFDGGRTSSLASLFLKQFVKFCFLQFRYLEINNCGKLTKKMIRSFLTTTSIKLLPCQISFEAKIN